jgi:alpha-N-arabinofuranosidase
MKKSFRFHRLGCLLFFISCISNGFSDVEITIPDTTIVHRSDTRIYGHFLEHIHHSVNGGLWGQAVWNCSFEQESSLPAEYKGKISPEEWKKNHPANFWTSGPEDGVTQLTTDAVNGKKCLSVDTEKLVDLVQRDFRIQKDDPLEGSIWIKGSLPKGLTVSLEESGAGLETNDVAGPPARVLASTNVAIGGIGDQWKEYPIHLAPVSSSDHGILRLELPASHSGEVRIDQFTLMPRSAQATGGFRPDLLQALKELHPAFLRWPGGDFVFGFDWRDSVGPSLKRGNKAGWGDLDPLGLGLDEFMKLCSLTGAEPLLVVDIAVNRPDLVKRAADLVEYCNGDAGTPMGKLRAENGHPEPYHVKLWEVGNEMWRIKPEEYVTIFREAAGAMKKMDPTIECIASGSGQLGTHRNTGLLDAAVIQQAGDLADYLSIHHYEDPDLYANGPAKAVAYWSHLGELIAKSPNPKMKLFMSEWNAMCTDLRGGLYAGGLLNAMERSDMLTLASPALLMRHVSAKTWDNAFINFDATRFFTAPNYEVMKLWRENYSSDVLALQGKTDELDVLPTLGDSGKSIVLKVVNSGSKPRHVTVTLPATFHPRSSTAIWISSEDVKAANTLKHPDLIKPKQGKTRLSGNSLRFRVPGNSAGVVRASEIKLR